jgi:hypothetical protein
VIDREGRIAGTQNGAAGEEALVALLGRAGLLARSEASRGDEEKKVSPADGARLIEVPETQRAVSSKPGTKTVFVLANGERLEATEYTIDGGSLRVVVGGEQRTIAIRELDTIATISANHERGIALKIPTNRSEVLVAF